ncbi:hypothetical protein CKM354_000641900 [Cercospora kikuchii]|uniref:Uncharacterized protein n=1 Tax=Cercospora kikuchii TaxID=84275 RepID=A0A9P3CI39_9PEZI|nr:uncharacterized protein CKM354_000641900 [Cercospora kikuchii]GIZ43181.1 hypothetical protein CKM354_000641900 [Cercospora kikuchii]
MAKGARANRQARRQAKANARSGETPQSERLRTLAVRNAWLAKLEAESKSHKESEAARVEEVRLARLEVSKAAKASEEDELAEKLGGLKMEKK